MPTSHLSAVNKENWKTVTDGRRRANASRRKCHLVRYAEPVRSDLSRSSIPKLSTVLNIVDQLQVSMHEYEHVMDSTMLWKKDRE